MSVSLIALGASRGAAEGPQGGKVVHGAASIAQTTARTTIRQTSQRAVIDWQGFDVDADHTVAFDQPGRGSATLNRVRSTTQSVIAGAIKAPGTVVIQNTAGVIFTGGAKVDTGGLVAASQTVDAQRFQKDGALRIGGGEQPGARVVNAGRISLADKGLGALVGTSVENAGAIIAKQGTVALASGKRTAIDLSGDGTFQIAVSGSSAGGGVTHTGRIEAGDVLVTAGDAARALDGVINTSGVIRATSARAEAGRITLAGRGRGRVILAGRAETGKGGAVTVTGQHVAVASTARVTAAGGSIRLGGDLQGGGSLRRAETTSVAPGALLSARGGKVVVWSDGTTRMDGRIDAAGGQVETSGKLALGLGAAASVVADAWLLDPRNVTIGATGAGVTAGVNDPAAGAGAHTVNAASLVAALQAGSDVTVTTHAPGSDAGDITLASALTWTGSGSLTLLADGAISFARAVTTTDGDLTAQAGGAIAVNAGIVSKGKADIDLDAVGNLLIAADVRATGSGSLGFTSRQGSVVATPGSAEDLRITTVSGSMAFSAANGSVILRRSPHGVPGTDYTPPVATGGSTIEVNSKSGAISMKAGAEILIKGEDKAGQWVRVGSNNSKSDLSFSAPRIQVQGGLASDAFAEVVTGAGGSITMDAGKISVITKKSLGRIAALDGADLTLRADRQRWWGELRAGSGGHTGGNVLVSGAIDATVEPLFGLADGKTFTLAAAGPTAPSSVASTAPFSVSTGGSGKIDIDAPITAPTLSLLSAEGVSLGKGATLTATGLNDSGTPLVIAAGRGFQNDAGADALVTSDPKARWLVYIDRFAGMLGDEPQSHGFDLYGRSISDTPPQVVTHTGNRVIYAERPVLTITGETLEKTYGTKATPGLTLAGFRKGDSIATALVSGPSVASDGTPAFADAGAYATEVAATASDQGYLLKLVDGTLTVNPAALTVTADDAARTYGEKNPVFTGKVTGFVLGQGTDDLAGSLGFTSPATPSSNAGTYAINGGGLTSGNYAITYVPGTLTVNKAALQVTVDDASRTYGSDNPTLTAGYEGFVLGQDESVLGGSLTTDAQKTSDVGSYGISTDGLISTNYEIIGTPGTLTIEKAPLTVTVDDKSRTYGSDNPKLTASYEGLVLGQDADVLGGKLATDATKSSDVGSYAITADGLTAKNYAITSVDGTLSVEKARLKVAVDDKSRIYGDANPALTASYSGFVLGQDESVLGGKLATDATKSSGVGGYAITADGLTAKNYAIESVDGTLTVGKAMLTVTADDKTRTYGSGNPVLTGDVAGFVLGDGLDDLDGKLVFSTPATATSEAGAYVITPSGLSGGNYAFTWAPGTLTVKKAMLQAVVKDASKTYGADNPTLQADYAGFVLGQDESVLGGKLTTYAKKGSDVGRYDIRTDALVSKNYEIVGTPGTLTVKKAPLTVAIDDKSRLYGSDNPKLTASYAGFVLGEDAGVLAGKLSTDAKKGSDAGSYAIVSGLTAKNYAITAEFGKLTVKPAPLTVQADDASRAAGTANPPFSATITGFVLGQSLGDLDGSLGFDTDAGTGSPAGSYALTPGGLGSGNYAIRFLDGTLTVTQGAPVVQLPEPPAVASGAERFRRGVPPLTPGDASFRTTIAEAPPALSDPFALTYSLGDIVAGAPAPGGVSSGASGAAPASGGFVAAAGNRGEASPETGGFVAAAGGLGADGLGAAAADCGGPINRGQLAALADDSRCTRQTVTESFWTTLANGAR